jgi:UDP-N-acetylmuramate dehydrogenase
MSLQTGVSLSSKTYYGMGGLAHWYAEPESLSALQEALAFAREKSLPMAVLGSGSNSVVSDVEFPGLILSLASLRRWHWMSPRSLFVEAGVTNTEIAEICLEQGVEHGSWMFRMPGMVGASVRMNARCYGGEISQVVQSVTTVNWEGRLKLWQPSEIFHGYKSTALMSLFVT